MIVPKAVQGGVNSGAGGDPLEQSGDHRSLRPCTMDQKPKGPLDNGPQGRHHPVLAWQQCASEGSVSSMESLPGGDLYSASDVPLPMFQKLRGGRVHMADGLVLSEDEDAPDVAQEGSPMANFKRRIPGGVQLPQQVVNIDEVPVDQMSTQSEDYPSHRVKFMCSYGGKIWPRPNDGQLRYVGGDNHLITVNRDITYAELMLKMVDIYSQVYSIKYKLPEEDLDALVSVSSDEDLRNMMEEYDKLEASDGSQRLRLFLFSGVDYDSTHVNDSMGDPRHTELRYVNAVNGIPETGSRKHSDAGSIGVPPLHLDSLIDHVDQWSGVRPQDSVPVTLLAPQKPHDVASLIEHVSVALPVSSIPLGVPSIRLKANAPSVPSSAPSSSPPLLARVAKPVNVPDLQSQFFPDQHAKVSGHPYSVPQPDSTYQDVENYGGNLSSGAVLHELVYRNPDPRRAPDSPPKMQHESLLVGAHPEHTLREEPRRLTDARIPRVRSHGMLTRLSGQHHMENASSGRPEAQQLPDVLPPLDGQQRHGFQQQHQQLVQGGWPPHPLEVQTDSYGRRVELFQPNLDSVIQPTVLAQLQQPVHFRSGAVPPPSHDAVYRPVERQSGEEVFAPFMHRSISSHTMPPPLGSAQTGSYHVGVGSAPSSPRVNYRESSGRHPAGQQQAQPQPAHRVYTGASYGEQQSHGRRQHPHNDSSSRPRPSTSPPRYRDHLGHADDRMVRPHQPQALVSSDQLLHEQVLYEPNPMSHNQYSEAVARSQLPQYLGHNPFQEGLSGYSEHQDGVDGRRHPFVGKEKSALQQFHPQHFNMRMDYQDQGLPTVDPLPVHTRFQDNPSDWGLHPRGRDMEETRLRLAARGWPGQTDYPDEVVGGESGPTHHLEARTGSYPHLPEDSDALLAATLGDSYLHRKAEWVEPAGTSNYHLRSNIPQSSALPVYSSGLGRAGVEGSQVPPFVGRASEADLYATGPAPRSGETMQDLRATPAFTDGSGHHQPSGQNTNTGVSRLMEDRAATGAFNHMASNLSSYPPSMRAGNVEPANSGESRWGLAGSDDSRVEGLLQARDRATNQERVQKLSGLGGPQGRLSRPSSGTNMIALEEDALKSMQGPITSQGNDALVGEDTKPTAYGLQNLGLSDGAPQGTAQVSLAAGQAQIPQPATSKQASLAILTPSIKVSTGPSISTATMPLSTTSSVTSMGSTALELVPTSRASTLFKPTPFAAPRMSLLEGDIGGSSLRKPDPMKSEHVISMSQLSATGLLAEDMASSVLGSAVKDPLLPEQSPAGVQKDEKGEWMHVSQDATAIIQAPLLSSPTFAMQNWEKNLAALDAEEEDEEDRLAAHESTAEEETVPALQPSTREVREEQIEKVEDSTLQVVASVKEEKLKSSNLGTASDAEAEAISRGLQTILNADLEEMRELGSGTFGTVYHGKWRGSDVAIKRIKASCFAGRPSERDRLIADFWREACTLGQLHHPNVVAFYGVVRDGPGGTLATVTEYMVNGSLKQVLQKKDRTIDRRKRLLIAMDAAFGMEYLHNKSIVHFDLKCDNLLVNMRDPHRPICKVGDLGLSKVKHQTMVSGGVRGTLPWMAPELLNGSSSMVTEKVDVFSFGIVMWELLTGEEPYAHMHYGAIIGGIVNNTLRPQIPTWCDPMWKSLMERCWAADPTTRPHFAEIASELRAMAAALHPKGQEVR